MEVLLQLGKSIFRFAIYVQEYQNVTTINAVAVGCTF